MSILNYLDKFALIRKLLHMDLRAEEMLETHEEKRKELDTRLERVTRATLNGETEWFLKLVSKDPNCALEVIKECEIKSDD